MMIEEVDLSSITRDSDKVYTKVLLARSRDDWEIRKWLRFGQAQLRMEEHSCWISAYLASGVTDFEHDSAYALKLPLIGVKYKYTMWHDSHFEAWIDPNSEDDFRIPPVGYNPMAREDIHICENCEKPHIIVPEGCYLPPVNKNLFEKVKGRRVEIVIGYK